jgi:hypothetical protein
MAFASRTRRKTMKDKYLQRRNIVFYALLTVVVVFVVELFQIYGPHSIILHGRTYGINRMIFRPPYWLQFALALASAILGLALVILTLKLKEAYKQRLLFILSGVSAILIPVFMFSNLFLWNLWGIFFADGYDAREPFVVKLFLFVCPVVFLIGAVASIVIRIKAKRAR